MYESLKGPWTVRQYGAELVDYDENTHRTTYRYNGTRYTIREIGVDVHTLYDGSGLKDRYPDGVIRGAEETRALGALLRAAPDMRDALQEILPLFEHLLITTRMLAPSTHEKLKAALRKGKAALQSATTPLSEQEGVA